MELKDKIRTIPHFPKKGIMFKDITTLLKDPHAFRYVIREMMHHFDGKNINIVASAESRGFILGAVLAHELHAGFVPLRKPGKLPYKTIKQEFETEYSIDAFEIHEDAIEKGDNVLIVDDLLATGGTAKAAIDLIEKLHGKIVGLAFLIELSFLKGREKLKGYDILTLVDYDKEE
ncbi:adenine phosphoribosyltransferase [Candidatus Woesearchaeota archaeon CG06_land_8_20_14_3_00_33_13]|nr:MAG: adenine phosphoribosyltransferase [Candidatus Woesearchaeota archaeon CG10_big_fil_rev_8_21_14_0_10_33_12]PIU72679.1 MAG: adenine phosphoribosyltransferase [Candidatus Woesearchaeota archaeon CG06_land_8_20_14_3_00_33_13]